MRGRVVSRHPFEKILLRCCVTLDVELRLSGEVLVKGVIILMALDMMKSSVERTGVIHSEFANEVRLPSSRGKFEGGVHCRAARCQTVQGQDKIAGGNVPSSGNHFSG